MQNNSKLSRNEVGSLILLAAILFGAVFRFFPPWAAGFPVNDGGMFYVMMNDLIKNHFIPPLYTTYNHLNIPFAYPPLALYIGAILSSAFHVSGITILRWLPALFNTLCIPAFYLLSREILKDKLKGAIATLAFALIPHLNTWLSAGGGLTRSLGVLFMMLTVMFSYRMFAENQVKAIWGAIIFGGLTVLSHTEATVFAIVLPIYIWLGKSRSMKSAYYGALVALGVIVIAGPWYAFVISKHGLAPVVSALQTGAHGIWSLFLLINVTFTTDEPYLGLIGVTGILGMIFLVMKREYFIPLMFVVIYLAQPRSAPTIGNIPLAMASASLILDAFLPALEQIRTKFADSIINRFYATLFLLFLPFILFNSIYQGLLLSKNHISTGEQTTMQWIEENTPVDSKFLILTGEPEAMCESAAEWFPALADRTSLSTLQGREWLLGNQFAEFIGHRASLQACTDDGLGCLNQEMSYFGGPINYIYISIKTPTYNCKADVTQVHTTRGIAIALSNSSDYKLVYSSATNYIFENASK